MLDGPVCQPVLVQILQVPAPAIGNYGPANPIRICRRGGLRLGYHEPRDRTLHISAYEVDNRLHVDASCHVTHEKHQCCHAHKGEQDTHGQCQMRDKLSLALRADRTQDDQGIGKSAQEGTERELIAAVASEIAQQPWSHLSRGQ